MSRSQILLCVLPPTGRHMRWCQPDTRTTLSTGSQHAVGYASHRLAVGEPVRNVAPAAIALQGPVDAVPADGEQLGEIVDAVLAGAVHAAQFGLLL